MGTRRKDIDDIHSEKEVDRLNIGFIGAGKVGCSIGKYLAESGQAGALHVKGYYSRSSRSTKDAAHFTDSKAYESIAALTNECDVIFLTVPDGSIQGTWQQVKECEIRGKTICHCSGAMSSRDAFKGIEETGAFGYSIHPLFAVSDKYNAYKELTGVSNDNILDLARYLSDTGKDMWIRHVLVPGLTDQEDDLKAMHGMLDELKTVKKVEILPYHSLGLFKWQNLGIPYTLEGVPAPTKEEVERAEKILGIRKAD